MQLGFGLENRNAGGADLVGENRVGPVGRMLASALRSIGSRRRIRPLTATAKPEITAQLLALAASGDLVPVIDRIYPLDDAGAALTRIDGGGVVGKVLVRAARADGD